MPDKNYFSILEFANKIELEDEVLSHLELTQSEFNKYFSTLAKYNNTNIIHFWINSLYKEFSSSCKMEGAIPPMKQLNNNVFFDTLQINNNRIHNLHNLVLNDGKSYEYRQRNVYISGTENGKEKIYWWAPDYSLVNDYMQEFIKMYKLNTPEIKNSDPFIKSAIIHLIFIRIHPYVDGNGRTGRMLHNIKFTELINKIYKTRLKLSPLNLSPSINLNRFTYCHKIDNTSFSLDKFDNYSVNRFIDFILTMADEQIYFSLNQLSLYQKTLETLSKDPRFYDSYLEEEGKIMKLKKILPQK